jgi:hypothetical protein
VTARASTNFEMKAVPFLRPCHPPVFWFFLLNVVTETLRT